MAAARDSKAAAQPENRYTKSVQSARHLNAFVLQMSEADQGAKHLTGALSAARNVQVGSPFPPHLPSSKALRPSDLPEPAIVTGCGRYPRKARTGTSHSGS